MWFEKLMFWKMLCLAGQKYSNIIYFWLAIHDWMIMYPTDQVCKTYEFDFLLQHTLIIFRKICIADFFFYILFSSWLKYLRTPRVKLDSLLYILTWQKGKITLWLRNILLVYNYTGWLRSLIFPGFLNHYFYYAKLYNNVRRLKKSMIFYKKYRFIKSEI